MDDRDVADRYWAGRTDRAFAFGSLHRAGVRLALGSDAPVAPLDPWIAVDAAVSRSRDGPIRLAPRAGASTAGSRWSPPSTAAGCPCRSARPRTSSCSTPTRSTAPLRRDAGRGHLVARRSGRTARSDASRRAASARMSDMRAVVISEFGVLPTVREVPPPTCPDDGVVLRVTATGVCRSDWHGWQGHDDDITLPHVPGHELAGVVVEVGPQVRSWAVGDEVTVPFVCACGTCAACLAGEQQVCERQRQPGFTDDGSFAELVALHHADVNLVRLPGRHVTGHRGRPRAAGSPPPTGPSPSTVASRSPGTGSRCTAAAAWGCRRSWSPSPPVPRSSRSTCLRPPATRPWRWVPSVVLDGTGDVAAQVHAGDRRGCRRLARRPRQPRHGDRVDPVAAPSRPARPGRPPARRRHRPAAARWVASSGGSSRSTAATAWPRTSTRRCSRASRPASSTRPAWSGARSARRGTGRARRPGDGTGGPGMTVVVP